MRWRVQAAVAILVFSVAGMQLTAATPAVAAGETVSITSPAAGSVVTGSAVSVTVVASVPADGGESPYEVELFVDGVSFDSEYCGSGLDPNVCEKAFSWDTTGLSGAHTLQAKFYYAGPDYSVLSSPVVVTVSNPVPTVAIMSPAPGSVVSGSAVQVGVTGSVPASLTWSPYQVELFVDGVSFDSEYCGSGLDPNVCEKAFSWDTTGLSGAHTLQAKFYYAGPDYSVVSSRVTVYVYTASRISFPTVQTVRAGATTTVRGVVVSRVTGRPLPGARLTVTLRPALGLPITRTVTATSTGTFQTSFTARYQTAVAVAVAPGAWWSGTSAATSVRVTAPVVCSVTNPVRRGRTGTVTCRAAYLPRGTAVKLQYYSAGWRTIARATTINAGRIPPLAFKFSSPGRKTLRVVLTSNRVYAATVGPALRTRIT
jgi:hypothetical protein